MAESMLAESILLTFSLLETAVYGVPNEFRPGSGVRSLIMTSTGLEMPWGHTG